MKRNTHIFAIGCLIATTMALIPAIIQAQSLNLDNFATGAGQIDAISGTHSATQTGTGIIGGTRTFQLSIGTESAGNPYAQPIQAQVRPSTATNVPSAFLWTVGYGAFPRIDMIYGDTTALGLDLTPYNRFRVSFQGLTAGVNFNIVAWQASNVAGTLGCNFAAFPDPFTVDFILSAYSPNGSFDWSNIEALDIVFQGASATGSPTLALTGFSAIPASEPPATFTCPATT